MNIRKIFNVKFPGTHEKKLDINELAKINIERIAIDKCGSLGSVYDGYTDNIRGKLNINTILQLQQQLRGQTKCLYVQDCKYNAQNLLKFVDIDHQLRLSILTQLTPVVGFATFVHHPRSIDKHTRLFYFYHASYRIFSGDLHELQKSVRRSTCDASGTHIITEIVCGIHLLVILQLSPGQEQDIDTLLLKLSTNLNNNNQDIIKLNSADRILLNQITFLRAYSNIYDLNRIDKFEDMYDKIIELRWDQNKHQPLKYILSPIGWFYGHEISKFVTCEPDTVVNLEHYLLQQSAELKRLTSHVNHHLPELLQGRYKNQLEDIQNKVLILQILEKNDILEISRLIWKIRKGEASYDTVNSAVRLDAPKQIQDLINEINTLITKLEAKIRLMKSLQEDRFEYCDVAKLDIGDKLNDGNVNELLFGNDSNTIIFFSTDTFQKEDPERWAIIYSEMVEERRNNPRLHLVYADFTDSKYKLKKMKMERSTQPLTNSALTSYNSIRHTTKGKAPLPPQTTNEYINILLLGESGVGKSTFINAFANYLRFQSLDEAQKGEPIVIIPVSYVMTINDDFEERIIKFGEMDSNENHNDFGQSVTQQCKAYVFNISKDKKLRIIDTPGFGDTRGDQQDDLNMIEIFSFLNNFTYLNGVCLLFKPEIIQLNPYIRSCFTQLFEYFGDNIRDHIIFCFTNARSTFFAPGSARPLLNAFFETFPVKNIPFGKPNTFSFDSEAFRYLVAVRNSIEFDENQRGEFKQSWDKSVTESQRFRDFLLRQDAYRKNRQWQSIKGAQIQINCVIRPILEATRNLLRNSILSKDNSSIELHATPAEPSSTICYSCSRKTPEKFGAFWILPDHLHQAPNMCSSNEQKPAEYRLEYEPLNNQSTESTNTLNAHLKCLYETCGKLTHFLMKYPTQTLVDDPFLTGINRMIQEEQSICDTQKTSNNANALLIDGLEQFKTKYQEHLNTIKSDKSNLILSNIYDLIQSVSEIPMVKIQLNAIREYQKHLVDNNQRVIGVDETGKK